MAQWRPLYRRLTESEKVLALAQRGDHFALWLYTALLPHTDREGRLNANPAGLAGTIFEGYDYQPAEIERAIHQLADVGLVILYRNGRNQHLVQYTKFQDMCKPDSREAKSDLPGPGDDGSETIAGSLSEPSPATTTPTPDESGSGTPPLREESAESPGSGDPLHVHVHVHEQVHEQPPLPPHEPQATSSEEAEGEDPDPSKAEEPQDDLTHYQRRRRDRPPDPLPASRLATLHPEAWAALTDFRRAIGDVTEGQFTAWAKTVAEHVDEHGEAAVADALRRTLEKTRLKHPFAYYRKVIGQPKSPTGDAADAEYREVTAAEFLEGRWN